MNVNYTREDAKAVMAMTALFRSLNMELETGNELLKEQVKLLKLCAEGMRELQEEVEWANRR